MEKNPNNEHGEIFNDSNSLVTICAPVRDKSEARFLESRLINEYKKHGFDIRHGSDEKHKHFGIYTNI